MPTNRNEFAIIQLKDGINIYKEHIMAASSRLSTAAQFFEDDGGVSEAISTYDRVRVSS